MNLIDLAFLLLLIWEIFSGWRKGLLVSALSIIGFLAGATLGIFISNYISTHWQTHLAKAILYLLTIAITSAILEQVGTLIGKGIHRRILFGPFKVLDSALGAILKAARLFVLAAIIFFLIPFLNWQQGEKYLQGSFTYQKVSSSSKTLTNKLLADVNKVSLHK